MAKTIKTLKKRNKAEAEREVFLKVEVENEDGKIEVKEFTVPKKIHPIDALDILRSQETLPPYSYLVHVIDSVMGEGSVDALREADLSAEDFQELSDELGKILFGELNAKK